MFRSSLTGLTQTGSGFVGRAARRAVARAATLAAITALALGTLSGTAEAQSVFTELTPSFYMTNIFHVSGGDADVYSKSGRYTDVIVSTGFPTIYSDGLVGSILLTYEVREVASNYTVLRRSETVWFAPPDGYRMVNNYFRQPTALSRRYSGQDHNWHDESAATSGRSYIKILNVRFDGPGRDDQGNAAMSGRLSIPVDLVRN
jgi:hypothetical protein